MNWKNEITERLASLDLEWTKDYVFFGDFDSEYLDGGWVRYIHRNPA